jgi:hypothetical protein
MDHHFAVSTWYVCGQEGHTLLAVVTHTSPSDIVWGCSCRRSQGGVVSYGASADDWNGRFEDVPSLGVGTDVWNGRFEGVPSVWCDNRRTGMDGYLGILFTTKSWTVVFLMTFSRDDFFFKKNNRVKNDSTKRIPREVFVWFKNQYQVPKYFFLVFVTCNVGISRTRRKLERFSF